MRTEIQDFIDQEAPSGLQLSPDGRFGAFVVTKPDGEENCYHSWLQVVDVENGTVRKLTSGKKEKSFAWEDGEHLFFVGNREKDRKGEALLYRISVAGGEAELCGTLPKGTRKIRCQNGILYCLVHEHYYEKEEDYEVFDEIPFWSNGVGIVNKVRDRLYRYDLKTGEARVLSPEYGQVEAFWAENGTVFFTCNIYTGKKLPQNGLYEYVEETDTVIRHLDQGMFSISYACRRNGRVEFLGSDMKRFGYNENPDLYVLEDGAPRLLARYDYSVKEGMCRDGRIYVNSTVGTDVMLQCFDMDGNVTAVTDRAGTVESFDICGGRILFTGMRDQGLSEVYSLENGKETCFTDFTARCLKEKEVSPIRHFTFTHEGLELDGFVIPPVGFDPSDTEKTYPGILTIHGGPRTVLGDVFHHEMQVWAGAGYFVFYCNPRGSDGRGNAFADIVAKQGSIDYEQLMAFTDEVLRQYPALDGDRLGVMGISYGGFMTNWIIGHTDRFKAAVPQCCIANWITKTNTTDIGYAFNTTQLGGDVWENYDKMWELSPLKYADRVKTPSLIIQCDEDYRCWVAEGVQMFSALKYHGVPARLLMIHGEHHSVSRLGKPKKRVRRLNEIVSWLDTYLK